MTPTEKKLRKTVMGNGAVAILCVMGGVIVGAAAFKNLQQGAYDWATVQGTLCLLNVWLAAANATCATDSLIKLRQLRQNDANIKTK